MVTSTRLTMATIPAHYPIVAPTLMEPVPPNIPGNIVTLLQQCFSFRYFTLTVINNMRPPHQDPGRKQCTVSVDVPSLKWLHEPALARGPPTRVGVLATPSLRPHESRSNTGLPGLSRSNTGFPSPSPFFYYPLSCYSFTRCYAPNITTFGSRGSYHL